MDSRNATASDATAVVTAGSATKSAATSKRAAASRSEAVPARRTKAPSAPRASKDAVLRAASELARSAAEDVADRRDDVGEHLGATDEGERLVAHRFSCTLRGYRGWVWTVLVARAPRARTATVCEVVLVPGDGALLTPQWLPWSERLRPGDLGPTDVLPFRESDPRLEPGFTASGDNEIDAVAIEELALARARILSENGRDEAAQRWYGAGSGPTERVGQRAGASCDACGFLVPLQGALGQVFGVCANEWSPDDGRVVALAHGCGAHSETDVAQHPTDWPDAAPMIDEMRVDVELRNSAPVLDFTEIRSSTSSLK